MSFFRRLQKKWNLKSVGQLIIVLIVFASTGFTVLFLKQPIIGLLSSSNSVWFDVLYYVFILPVYNVVLLFYGFVFGQFSFFWEFEKRMFKRMIGKK